MYKICEYIPELKKYEGEIKLRMDLYESRKKQILTKGETLNQFANAHKYFGFHKTETGWVYREWAPAADKVFLTGDFCSWHWIDYPLKKLENGVWEIELPGDLIHQGSKVRTIVKNGLHLTEHLPLYTLRAVQDPENFNWCAEVWDENEPYDWTDQDFKGADELYIYEAHVGMAQEEYRVGTYREFADKTLPRVKKAGYNTIQLMAIMEHPYYGSFGYQVSNFFAASSRFGLPSDLRYLINTAHKMGIRVLLDVVHSHAVKNTLEGINMFDGTVYQFFHEGAQGDHPAWGTKCFNYGKPEVIHFLLSNLKFWMEFYHFDGFRFDGVTSMLYHDHGLGVNFSGFPSYFSMNTDTEAITYLQLANELIREVNPNAVTVAEDMSGMPGMCVPVKDGGIGFDYRLAMGLPDMWIRMVKTQKDEDWNMSNIWRELCFRSFGTVAYVESHDQALVGDKTMMFRLADANMYTDMNADCHTFVIDRAVALHKMIRLVTIAAGGNGYLNFMGNEFGHPEWIDFPREGNGDSYQYCRRQWSLVDNNDLKYKFLNQFDHDMVAVTQEYRIFSQYYPNLLGIHDKNQTLAFERGGLVFVFNFNPSQSFTDMTVQVPEQTSYEVVFSTDDKVYGGQDRIARIEYPSINGELKMYMPARTAVVLKPMKKVQKETAVKKETVTRKPTGKKA